MNTGQFGSAQNPFTIKFEAEIQFIWIIAELFFIFAPIPIGSGEQAVEIQQAN